MSKINFPKFEDKNYKKFNALVKKFEGVVKNFNDDNYSLMLPSDGMDLKIGKDLLYYLYLSILDFQKNALLYGSGHVDEYNKSKIPACAQKLVNLQKGIETGNANLNSVYRAMDNMLVAFNKYVNLIKGKKRKWYRIFA